LGARPSQNPRFFMLKSRISKSRGPNAGSLKTYDRAYFDEFYRNPRTRVATRDSLERKVHMAVSVAEFLMGRRIQSVLDVGSGEAQWRAVLRRMRKNIRYIAVDPSEYVVAHFGKQRNIRLGSFGGLGSLRLPKN